MSRFQASAPVIDHQAPFSLADEAADQLLRLAPRVVQSARHYLRAQNLGGITLPQLRALAHVLRQPESTLGELAEHLAVSAPSASALADRLVQQGLLDAKIPPENRRRVSLVVTSAGEKIVERATRLWQTELARRLTSLTEEELRVVIGALDSLARRLP